MAVGMICPAENERKSFILVFFECLTACALILSCDTMYITLAPHDLLVRNGAAVLVVIGAVGMIFASRGYRNKKRVRTGILYAAILAVWLLIFIIVRFYNKGSFLKLSVALIALLLYYFIAEGAERVPAVLTRYGQIMTVIAAFSILCWLVFSIFKFLPSTGVGLTWWNGTDHNTEVTSFYGVYFEPQTKYLFGSVIPRNCGFFVEAPIASLHFCFAFLISLFLEGRFLKAKNILLLVAILTTFSATGYVIAAAAIAAYFLCWLFSPRRFGRIGPLLKTVCIILILIIVAALVLVCISVIKGRVGGESWNIRLEDFRATFAAWKDSPVFGNGLYNFDAVKVHFEGARATNPGFSCSNSLGTILADGGIWFGILYIGAFLLALGRSIRNKEPGMFFFSLFVFVIFAVTIVAYDHIILMMFIFMGAYKCLGARRCSRTYGIQRGEKR